MSAGRYDIFIERGATWSRRVAWRAGADRVPLAGCSARLRVGDRLGSALVLLELTTAGGGIVIDDDMLLLELSAERTAALDWRRGVYTLTVTQPDGRVTRLLEGGAMVWPE